MSGSPSGFRTSAEPDAAAPRRRAARPVAQLAGLALAGLASVLTLAAAHAAFDGDAAGRAVEAPAPSHGNAENGEPRHDGAAERNVPAREPPALFVAALGIAMPISAAGPDPDSDFRLADATYPAAGPGIAGCSAFCGAADAAFEARPALAAFRALPAGSPFPEDAAWQPGGQRPARAGRRMAGNPFPYPENGLEHLAEAPAPAIIRPEGDPEGAALLAALVHSPTLAIPGRLASLQRGLASLSARHGLPARFMPGPGASAVVRKEPAAKPPLPPDPVVTGSLKPGKAQLRVRPQPIALLTPAERPARAAAPAVALAPEPPPALDPSAWKIRLVRKATVVDGRTLRADDLVIRLVGVELAPPWQACTRLDGVKEPCADRAATLLELMTRDRPILCRHQTPEGAAVSYGSCKLGNADLAEAIIRRGYAARAAAPAAQPGRTVAGPARSRGG